MVELPRWLPEVVYLGIISAVLVAVSQAFATLSLWQVVAHSIPVTAVTVVLARAMGGPLGPFIRPVAAVWLGAALVWAMSYYRRASGRANLNAN